MFIKRYQNRFLLLKIIRQKGDLIMHFYFHYRNCDSSKKCFIIFANNNCSKYVFFDKSCDVFFFESVYEY